MADFEIIRNLKVYKVNVQQRKDKISKLQITVSNKEEAKDSDYLIF